MEKPKINKAWHAINIIPKNATSDQRIEWHMAHHKHCQCRGIPKKLLSEIKKRGIKVK